MLCPWIRRDNEQKTAPEHTPAFKAKVALAAIKGDRTLAQLAEQFDVHANQITTWKTQLEGGAADVFGSGGGPAPTMLAIDVKSLHAKIGELTLENDFLEGTPDAARRAASGVPFCRLADAERFIGWRRDQGRPPSRQNADAANGDRGPLPSSADNETGAWPQDLPVSAARNGYHAAEPGLGYGYHLHSDGARVRLSRCRPRLVLSPCSVVAGLNHAGSGVLRRNAGERPREARKARDLQHGSRQPVHWRGLRRCTCQARRPKRRLK